MALGRVVGCLLLFLLTGLFYNSLRVSHPQEPISSLTYGSLPSESTHAHSMVAAPSDCDFTELGRSRIAYFGWLGSDNLGDDLMWHVGHQLISEFFRSSGAPSPLVWAPKSAELKRIADSNGQSPAQQFDVVVLGGGSLLTHRHLTQLVGLMELVNCTAQHLFVFGTGFDNYDPVRLSIRRINEFLQSNAKTTHVLWLSLCKEMGVRNFPSLLRAASGGVRGQTTHELLASCNLPFTDPTLPIIGDSGILVRRLLAEHGSESDITACSLDHVLANPRRSVGQRLREFPAEEEDERRQWFRQQIADVEQRWHRTGHRVMLVNWGNVGTADGTSGRRPMVAIEKDFAVALAELLTKDPQLVVVAYAMSPTDVDVLRRLMAGVAKSVPSETHRLMTFERPFFSAVDLIKLHELASLSIGLKLHASVVAMSAGVNNIMLRYRLKALDLISEVGPVSLRYSVAVSELTTNGLLKMIDDLRADPKPQLLEFAAYEQKTFEAYRASMTDFFQSVVSRRPERVQRSEHEHVKMR